MVITKQMLQLEQLFELKKGGGKQKEQMPRIQKSK